MPKNSIGSENKIQSFCANDRETLGNSGGENYQTAYHQMGRGLSNYENTANEYEIGNVRHHLESNRITHRSKDRKNLFNDE